MTGSIGLLGVQGLLHWYEPAAEVSGLVSQDSAIGDTLSCDAPYSAIGFRGKLSCDRPPRTKACLGLRAIGHLYGKNFQVGVQQ